MYIPSYNREDDPEVLLKFMQRYSFATLVSGAEAGLIASHLPVVVTEAEGAVTITGHFARANPHADALAGEMLVIFTGPHAYVSPAHYDKRESVPTWNYVAVHAYGAPQPLTFAEHPERMRALMLELIEQHEPSYAAQWNSLSEKYRHGMMRGIVGFELPVTRLEGKAKLSQNRLSADQRAVARALGAHPEQAARETANLMKKKLSAEGSR